MGGVSDADPGEDEDGGAGGGEGKKDATSQARGQSSQDPAPRLRDPAKRPTKADANAFLSLVKQRFSEKENLHVYAEVVSCFKEAGTCPQDDFHLKRIIERVTELLDGHPDLVAGFNRFTG